MIAQAMMFTGVYPLVPHLVRRDGGVKSALGEWGMAIALSAARPAGFLPLPGARGPRPIIALHGYAMNRANFLPLAFRLARAGLGPIVGFEYWTLGRTAAAARQLAWFVDQVRAETGAAEVDVIGHSMGGVVAHYYVALLGGDGAVKNLVTIGSPHAGTDVSAAGIGYAMRELAGGSQLVKRLAAAPAPAHTHITTIVSHADALVPAARQPQLAGAERIELADLGHVAMLGSRRVAQAILERLGAP